RVRPEGQHLGAADVHRRQDLPGDGERLRVHPAARQAGVGEGGAGEGSADEGAAEDGHGRGRQGGPRGGQRRAVHPDGLPPVCDCEEVMPAQTRDLWDLVRGRPQVDPHDLAGAIEEQAARGTLDYRTRLLIRDSLEALRKHWGAPRFADWVNHSPGRSTIQAIREEEFDAPGFASLAERIVEKTDPDTVKPSRGDLGSPVPQRIRLRVGGLIAVPLRGYLSRHTDDIDVVGEVPSPLRTMYPLLEQLRKRYGLELTHFQSHYLPAGWEN